MSVHVQLRRPVAWRHAYQRSVPVTASTTATVAKDFSALPTCGSVRPSASQLALRKAQAARDDG